VGGPVSVFTKIYTEVQDKTIWLKTSEAGLVEAGSNPSIESF
jgi:hypothetical protein